MDNGNKKPIKRQGMGFIPFFNDLSVYKGIKLLAGQRKLKTGTLILEIVCNHYNTLMGGQTLNTFSADEFHKQVTEASRKQKTRDVPDFIEYCCSKYLEKAVESMKPAIKRG